MTGKTGWNQILFCFFACKSLLIFFLYGCCPTRRAWAQDVMIPTTQTSTASGLTSQMWNLATMSWRFVRNTTTSSQSTLKRVSFINISSFTNRSLTILSTDQCKSLLPGSRIGLQQQYCALWCSLHGQLCLRVRLSHVNVSTMSEVTLLVLIFLTVSIGKFVFIQIFTQKLFTCSLF